MQHLLPHTTPTGSCCATGSDVDRERNHDRSRVELRFVGACIVPVMFEPQRKLPVLVMASELRRTCLGRTFYEWDAFGGKAEPEETVEQAAAREFLEESMGVVQLEGIAAPTDGCGRDGIRSGDITSAIADALAAREYLARVDVSYLRRLIPLPRFTVYTLFLVQAVWDPTVPQRFAELRKQLLHTRSLLRSLRPPPALCFPQQLPVDGGPWLPAPGWRVLHVQDAAVVAPGSPPCGHAQCGVWHGLHRHSACLQRMRSMSSIVTTLLLSHCDTAEVRTVQQHCAVTDPRPVRAYIEWVHATAAARAALLAVPEHVRCHRAAHMHGVDAAYLEKRTVRLMTIPQVQGACGSSHTTLLPPGVGFTVPSRLQDALRLWVTGAS